MKTLRLPAVEEKSGYSDATIYRRIASKLWTTPVRLSAQCSAWPEHEVDALLAAVVAGASDDHLRTLVARLHIERGAGAQQQEQWQDGIIPGGFFARVVAQPGESAKVPPNLCVVIADDLYCHAVAPEGLQLVDEASFLFGVELLDDEMK